MNISPIHPGEHLAEFIEEYGITAYRLARAIHVQQTRISHIIHGQRAISADTAIRLGRYFGTSAHFWLNLQAQFDIAMAEPLIDDEIAVAAVG